MRYVFVELAYFKSSTAVSIQPLPATLNKTERAKKELEPSVEATHFGIATANM